VGVTCGLKRIDRAKFRNFAMDDCASRCKSLLKKS
jgi:hypothetical protein